MRLAHLSLGVADQQASRRFYETFFGFDCDGEPDMEGCLHQADAHGFDLALAARADASPSRSRHFGIEVAGAESVRHIEPAAESSLSLPA